MDFPFYPLRFEFAALDPILFPPGKAANVLRGALGMVFRSIACTPECRAVASSRGCGMRAACPYARIFEPVAEGSGPSGLADTPRPFVFRARHLDGVRLRAGEAFHFDLNVFSLDAETIPYFILTFSALAREGLGASRGRAELLRVRRLAAGWQPEAAVYPAAGAAALAHLEPVTLGLEPDPSAPGLVRVEFLSPLELKHGQRVVERPEFPILFARVRDRIANLRMLYGWGSPVMDYQGSARRAEAVRLVECLVRHVATERRSSRTGQVHQIGGFVGSAVYEGELAEFLPWLKAARYTGIGRQAVWGKGEIRLSAAI